MSRHGLVLIGAGGHARACIDVIEQRGGFDIVGLVGAPEERGTVCLGYPVIGVDADLGSLAGRHRHAVVAVGQLTSPVLRIELHRRAVEAGFELPVIVSPQAYVSPHAMIGEGTVVLHGAIINAGARIGRNCIINSRALIEHDARVGDHCHVSTAAVVNGQARIGEGSFIGSGSVVRESCTIGAGCVVGMGLAVRRDLADHTRHIGAKPHG
ncbi:MAG: hypothetical protein RLZZ200_672 [Pseudomonadota bacterium]|jgi:sugar O-acyltransferase (sialic acid O-acetyltransferase NeuD family)